jgi:hypothetical protein
VSVRSLAPALAAAALVLAGCAPAPPLGEPIGREELAALARALSAPGEGVGSVRGSGSGEVTVSGRGSAVSFAFVYVPPGWMRVDVRPELGAAGHGFASLSVLDGQCLRTYIPGEAVEVCGCLSDLMEEVPDIDPAALALGIPRFAFLTDLKNPRLARQGGAVRLEGDLGQARLELRAEGSPLYVSDLRLEVTPGGRALSVTYAGRGWHAMEVIPRAVRIDIRGNRLDGRIGLELRRVQAAGRLAREDYELDVQPGTRSVTWGELDFGRER